MGSLWEFYMRMILKGPLRQIQVRQTSAHEI